MATLHAYVHVHTSLKTDDIHEQHALTVLQQSNMVCVQLARSRLDLSILKWINAKLGTVVTNIVYKLTARHFLVSSSVVGAMSTPELAAYYN